MTDTRRLGAAESLQEWSDALAAATPEPAGGAVLGLAAALAASLMAMAARLTAGRAKYEAVGAEFAAMIVEADRLRGELLDLAERDALAYRAVSVARAIPRDVESLAGARRIAIATALYRASDVPLDVLRCCRTAAALGMRAIEAGNRNAAADVAVAVLVTAAVARGARLTISANLDVIEALEPLPGPEAVSEGALRERAAVALEAPRAPTVAELEGMRAEAAMLLAAVEADERRLLERTAPQR
jgi:methenyltetrahydrofolate cyclohydrolase